MNKRKKRSPIKRIAIDIGGFGLILLGILTGWLPGPGGIPLVLAGLGLLSLNYEWAERMLKNFEKKRVELTDKYLMADRETSITMDIISVLMIAGGVWIVVDASSLIFRGLGIGLIAGAVVALASNQKRIERLLKKLKKH